LEFRRVLFRSRLELHLTVGATAVLEVHDLAVGGELVGADAEHRSQGPGDRHQEPTGAAGFLGPARDLRPGAAFGGPALRRGRPTLAAEMPWPAESHGGGELVQLLVPAQE